VKTWLLVFSDEMIIHANGTRMPAAATTRTT
jgi:hypothetical protein